MSLSFMPDLLHRNTVGGSFSVTPNYLGDRLGLQLNKLKTPVKQGRPIGSLDVHPGARK